MFKEMPIVAHTLSQRLVISVLNMNISLLTPVIPFLVRLSQGGVQRVEVGKEALRYGVKFWVLEITVRFGR